MAWKTPKERAAAAQGMAPRALIQQAKPGAIFTVVDKAIAFPNERLPGAGARLLHSVRPVVVMMARLRCTSSQPNTLLVVPCSSSHKGMVGDWDLAVPSSERAFRNHPTVAYASLVQPILKSELDERWGDVSPEFLVALQRVLASNMALVGAIPEDVPLSAAEIASAEAAGPAKASP